MAKPIPTEAADPNGIAARYIARHGIEKYKREYQKGWRASMDPKRETGLDRPGGGSYSDAWEDGYLDAANRENDKWHLLRCPKHDNTETGCGVA